MPVFLHPANLVFSREIISTKYKGGENQFRIDFDIGKSEVNQEDDELFLIAKMNMDEFVIDELMERGLFYKDNFSSDFVAISRYGGAHWTIDWLNNNETFAWHSKCNQSLKERAIEISGLTMDQLMAMADEGINVFDTIKLEPK